MNPKEIAQQMMLHIDMLEPEAAERIAGRETERIEFEAEVAAHPDKWKAVEELAR